MWSQRFISTTIVLDEDTEPNQPLCRTVVYGTMLNGGKKHLKDCNCINTVAWIRGKCSHSYMLHCLRPTTCCMLRTALFNTEPCIPVAVKHDISDIHVDDWQICFVCSIYLIICSTLHLQDELWNEIIEVTAAVFMFLECMPLFCSHNWREDKHKAWRQN